MIKKSLVRNIIFAEVLLSAIAASATIISSHVTTSRRPSFEVASIKPIHSAREIPGPWGETSDYFA
jgi:hypothetical protein